MLLLQSSLKVKREGDVFTEEYAAGLKRGVVVDAEIGAVDDRACARCSNGLAVGVRSDSAELALQGDGLGDAAEREVAHDREVVAVDRDRAGDECGGRELFDLEEVVGAKVAVAVSLIGVD